MAAAVGAVLNVNVVNWQHGVQCIKERAKPCIKMLAKAVSDLAERLSSGGQCERQLGGTVRISGRQSSGRGTEAGTSSACGPSQGRL